MALTGWRVTSSSCFFAFPELSEPRQALECVCCFRRFEVDVFQQEPELSFCPLGSHFKHCYFFLDQNTDASVKEHGVSIMQSMMTQQT